MPSKSPNDKPRFNFRVTKTQYERINELAKAAKRNASDYARERVLMETASNQQMQESLLHRVLAVEETLAEIQASLAQLLGASNLHAELAAASIAAASLLRDTGQPSAEDRVADHIDLSLSAARAVIAIHRKAANGG